MNRRRFLVALVTAPAVGLIGRALAGCGRCETAPLAPQVVPARDPDLDRLAPIPQRGDDHLDALIAGRRYRLSPLSRIFDQREVMLGQIEQPSDRESWRRAWSQGYFP